MAKTKITKNDKLFVKALGLKRPLVIAGGDTIRFQNMVYDRKKCIMTDMTTGIETKLAQA